MDHMKNSILSRIAADIRECWIGLLAFGGYMLLMMLFFHEVCPLLIVTGVPCPGCGLTRAGILLLQGKFAEAFQMHAFIYIWFAFILYFLYNRYIRQRRMKYTMQLIIIIIIAMLIYYGCRMIMYFPHREPMIWSEHRSLLDFRHLIDIIQQMKHTR